MREERLEFAVKLRCESLVVAQDERRSLQLLDDVRHRECLSGTGHSKQRDGINTLIQSIAYTFDRTRLIARRLIFAVNLELHT